MLKKLIRWPLRILVVLIVILLVIVFAIDLIAKTGVEKGATYALGVNTTVDSFSIKLLQGQMEMKGLTVKNPEGFKSENLMKSGTFQVKLQTGSIFTDTVVVDSFILDGLEMHIEQGLGKSNVSVIMDNLKKLESDAPAEDDPKEAGKKVKVNKIIIRNVNAYFHIGGAPAIKVPVAEIVIEDLDSEAGGVEMAKLVSKVMIGVFEGVFDAAKGVVSAETLKGMSNQVKDLGAAALEQSKEAIEGAGNILKDAGNGLGGLLKKFPGTKEE